jgi:uncharacterized protein (DUF302 family)
METRAFLAQHVTLRTGAPFDGFVQKLEAQLGQHDPAAYFPLLTDPSQAKAVETAVNAQLGSSGMMIFAMLEVGKLMALQDRPLKARQYLIGNSLFAFQMVRHDIRAGLYAPLRVLVFEDADGNAVVEYDRPTSMFGQLGDADIDAVAEMLDGKLADLLQAASQ